MEQDMKKKETPQELAERVQREGRFLAELMAKNLNAHALEENKEEEDDKSTEEA
jgi:hypothetical protein